MLLGLSSNKKAPNSHKFSIQTASEYCAVVKQSIERARSHSKKALATRRLNSPTASPHTQKGKELPRHIQMRSKLAERSGSRSRSNSYSARGAGLNENQQPTLNCSPQRKSFKIPERRWHRPSYEEEHLLESLLTENETLKQSIGGVEEKIKRMEKAIEEQRTAHQIQRDMYLLQVRKLRETLEMQTTSRSSTTRLSSASESGDSVRVRGFDLIE